jgi:hypothetical protein
MRLVVVTLGVLWAVVAGAQDPREFVAQARAATERFKDQAVATTEGYVKVGPDFPAMGEHWVNGELVVRGEFDAARPAILTYATIRGERTLTGAVYAIAIGPGQKVPDALPGAHWHDHVGSIDEESLLFGHDAMPGGAGDSVRLVVMHAWVWVENPAGTFATDNWSLPFARVGAQAPPNVPPDAARAMSLVSGGGAYYAMLFASVGQLEERHADAVRGIVARHAERVSDWWRSRGGEISRQDLEWLSAAWVALEAEVARAVPAEAAKRLKRI